MQARVYSGLVVALGPPGFHQTRPKKTKASSLLPNSSQSLNTSARIGVPVEIASNLYYPEVERDQIRVEWIQRRREGAGLELGGCLSLERSPKMGVGSQEEGVAVSLSACYRVAWGCGDERKCGGLGILGLTCGTA